jgi:hypothetical protein
VTHEIDSEIELELDKEVIELTKVSSIAMRVKQSEASIWVPEIKSYNLVATLCVNEQNVQGSVISVGNGHGRGGRRHHCELAIFALLDLVGGRRWWKESELGRQLRDHATHSPPNKMKDNPNSLKD